MSQTRYSPDTFRRAQNGDADAREAVVLGNLGLVRSVTRRFQNSGADVEDLVSVGCIGLLKAIDRFKPELGFEFSTYAVHLIVGEIRKYLRDQGQVKVPRRLKQLATRIREAEKQLQVSLGRNPTVSEIADHLGTTSDEVVWTMDIVKGPLSLDSTFGEEGDETLGQKIGSSPWDEMAGHLDLIRSIEALESRERLLITLRYYHGKSQEEVARLLGISQSHVSRIEKETLLKIKEQISC